jgi:ATP-binding cassette, subfamily B, bacterial CvaB/MchF/RaxB
MVAKAMGSEVSLSQARKLHPPSARGMTLNGLIRVAEDLGLQPTPVSFELAALDTLDLPAILHWGFSHYVVLADVAGDRLTIFDPGHGRQVITVSEAAPLITGVAIEFAPDVPARSFEGTLTPLRFFDLLPDRSRVLGPLGLTIGISLCVELMLVLSPLILARIMDSAANPGLAVFHLAILALLTLSGLAVARAARSVLVIRLSGLTQGIVMKEAFRRLMANPASFFEQRYSTYIVSRFEITDRLRTVLSENYLNAFIDTVLLCVVLVAMASLSLQATAIAAAAAGLVGIMRYYVATRSIEHLDSVIHARSFERLHLLETVRAIRALKQLRKTAERTAGFERRLDNSIVHQSNYSWYQAASDSIASYAGDICLIGVVIFLVVYKMSAGLTTVELLSLMLYTRMVMDRATLLSSKFAELATIGVQLEHLADIVEEQPEQTQSGLAPAQWGDLSVRDLWFSYDGDLELIRGFEMDVARGQFVAIQGPSGCGKSTILKLVSGLLPADSGRICWSGVDIASLDPVALRRAVGFVFQDDELLEGDIVGNVTLFERNPDVARVWAACGAMQIARDIKAMPMQLQTMVGERGTALSGGQRQRILLARALYHQPEVLLLDEATSEIDPENERRIHAELRLRGLTVILVTHRAEAVGETDKVYQLSSFGGPSQRSGQPLPDMAQP